MKKRILILILMFVLMILSGCTTKNNITNEVHTGQFKVTDLENLIQNIVKDSNDSILSIVNYKSSLGNLSTQSTGSGFVYESKAVLTNGKIKDASKITAEDEVLKYQYKAITNSHVIVPGLLLAIVYKNNKIKCEVVEESTERDLAIFSFQSSLYIPSLEIVDSDTLRQGSFVLVMGAPTGADFYNSVSFGIVSHPHRYMSEKEHDISGEYFIQTDAAVNPGNSGGPLLNMEGKVVGVVLQKIVKLEVEGMGFAIPSNDIKKFIGE